MRGKPVIPRILVRDASFGLSEAEQLFVRALGLRERLLAACAAASGAGATIFVPPTLTGVLGEAEALFDPRRWNGFFEHLATKGKFWRVVCGFFEDSAVSTVLCVPVPSTDPGFYADALAPILAKFAGFDVFAAKQRAFLASREADALDPRLLRAEILRERLSTADFFHVIPRLTHTTPQLLRAALAAVLVRSPAVSSAANVQLGEEAEEGSGPSDGGAASAVSSANFGGTDTGDGNGSVVGQGVDFDHDVADGVVERLWKALEEAGKT